MSYCNFAEFYDSLTEDVNYESQAKYLVDLLHENGADGGILLDLACGTASLSWYISQYGYDVIAVDESEEMLSIARTKLDNLGNNNIMLLCQSMEELDLFGTIDAAVCTLDSFNHLDSFESFKLAVSKVSLFMNIGGVFVFDVNTPYKHKTILGDNTFVIEDENVYCVWQNEYTDFENTVDISLDFFRKNNEAYTRTTQFITEKAYDIDMISKMLSDVGFDVLAIYDDMSKKPLEESSERAVFVARKVK